MQIIDSLHSIFDKQATNCKRCNSIYEISEKSKSATFNKLSICKDNSLLGVIENNFYKGLSKITHERSSFLLDKDCDGAVFYEEEDTLVLLLVDLKSSFHENEIFSAYKQDFFTFMKLHMMLSLCENYNPQHLKIICYAACPPCDKNSSDNIKDNLFMKEQLEDERFIDKCLKAYLYTKKFSCTIRDIPFVENKRLHENILTIPVEFRIYTPEHKEDKEGVIRL